VSFLGTFNSQFEQIEEQHFVVAVVDDDARY